MDDLFPNDEAPDYGGDFSYNESFDTVSTQAAAAPARRIKQEHKHPIQKILVNLDEEEDDTDYGKKKRVLTKQEIKEEHMVDEVMARIKTEDGGIMRSKLRELKRLATEMRKKMSAERKKKTAPVSVKQEMAAPTDTMWPVVVLDDDSDGYNSDEDAYAGGVQIPDVKLEMLTEQVMSVVENEDEIGSQRAQEEATRRQGQDVARQLFMDEFQVGDATPRRSQKETRRGERRVHEVISLTDDDDDGVIVIDD